MTGLIAPEEDRGLHPVVFKVLCQLGNDEVFKQCPPEGVIAKLIGGTNTQETACDAGIVEVEFGCTNQSLVEVAVMGRQQKHNKGGFENGEPASFARDE